ncbi:3-oxoacyl-ACP synthase [Pedobacter insulae]|uniref:Transcription elongation factor, GreA/GreB family n=1 Tax=Pedobacter insulae TaxID=414048 RepID=A0A1I2UI71_9SPHI|nr:3-oxoacyl-ACP synthase [Pedobacter insulae]SFG76039.1 Transcription elongation factor, GreA/GreB family [Pedobacter insulae]
MQELKASLYKLCQNFIEERIQTATIALKQAREASNDDTKSSAGDKYETSREMMQQDIDRNKRLLIDAEENLMLLNSIKEVVPTNVARNGSLVYTNQGNFYLSISAGQLHLGKDIFFAISAFSPIGKLLLGKAKGDQFDFNGKKYIINEIS